MAIVPPGDIVTQPSSKIVFNAPYDDKHTYHIRLLHSDTSSVYVTTPRIPTKSPPQQPTQEPDKRGAEQQPGDTSSVYVTTPRIPTKSPHRSSSTKMSNHTANLQDPSERRQQMMAAMRAFLDQQARLTDAMLEAQFQEIRREQAQFAKQADYATKIAQLEKNTAKNRYPDVLPYDANLRKMPMPDGRYVNASLIKHPKTSTQFICTQGPLDNTIGDFWEMAAKKNVRLITMLTDCVEGEKVKCAKYWCEDKPACKASPHERNAYKMRADEVFVDYVRRSLIVRWRSNPTKIHYMMQLQYSAWPDHGVPPNLQQFLEFLAQMKQHHEQHEYRIPGHKRPIIVHCSAGVGRSGTVVALYFLKELIDRERLTDKDLDLKQLVLMLRRQRPHMVQAAAQYQFLHRAVAQLCRNYLAQHGPQMNANN